MLEPEREMKARILAWLHIPPRSSYTTSPSPEDVPEFVGLVTRGFWACNAKDTSGCHPGLESWIVQISCQVNNARRKAKYPIPCAVIGCEHHAEVGAHVYINLGGTWHLYLAPFCKDHNNKRGSCLELEAGAMLRRAPFCELVTPLKGVNDRGYAIHSTGIESILKSNHPLQWPSTGRSALVL